jgi:hypothetical protein
VPATSSAGVARQHGDGFMLFSAAADNVGENIAGTV